MGKPRTIRSTPAAVPQSDPDIVVLKFADSRIPVFKETRDKDYIKYGADNRYPEYLTYLFDKSAKHNAIITGKANYVYGNGFENGETICNRLGDTINDVAKRTAKDVELYGGFRLEVIWNMAGKVQEVYHVDYSTLRNGKNGGFYWKQAWSVQGENGVWYGNSKDQEEFIPEFNPKEPFGSQIYAYNEYRPMVRFYPLPSYIGCNNYVETDIEISKYYLSAIRNGMMPSKMVQFYQGEPSEDKKREIEARFTKKFSGAENAGRMILVFNNGKDKQVDVSDLSASEVDKQFVELNKTCQQEIFSGHLVTSPMLFGIKTEGQLGGNTELYTAYAIFQNTYSKPKAEIQSKEFTKLFSFSIFAGQYTLRPTDPIGLQFDVKDVINSLPKAFVFKALNIPEDMWNLENIGADNRPTPTTPIPPAKQVDTPGGAPAAAESAMANDNIKNLSTKQHQQVMRIIRQHSKGQLTDKAAKALLRAGYGLTDEDINDLLGIVPATPIAAAAFGEQDDIVLGMFDACGDSRNDFEILKTKRVMFSSELEAEGDEAIFIQEAFKTYDVTTSEDAILELIRKDKRITPEVIAKTIGETVAYVQSKIDSLTARGYLESTTETIGTDEIVERVIPESVKIAAPPSNAKIPPTQIFIKYSYEVKPGIGPSIIPTTRPFCRRMVQLNRLYSRAEIESISSRLGYSVWDRKGGFWGHLPECRHRWVSNIVVKKAAK